MLVKWGRAGLAGEFGEFGRSRPVAVVRQAVE
jgi:hypothetical protein